MIVSMEISQIKFSPVTQSYVVTLKEQVGSRVLNIVIGPFEAQSIAFAIDKVPLQRPLTHDLLSKIIESLEAKVKKIVVKKLQGNTYFADLELEDKEGKVIQIDSRPSDAMALAIRVNSPIFANESILSDSENIENEPLDFLKEEKSFPEVESMSDTERLKVELNAAIESENYERAAEIRDKLNKIS